MFFYSPSLAMNVSVRFYLLLILCISLLASLGSLYVSSYGDPIANLLTGDLRNPLLGMPPCTLCRYVRVMLFPIVIMSIVALLRRDRQIRVTMLPFSVLGFIVALYSYGLEMHRRTQVGQLCGINAGVNCGEAPLMYGGRITLSLAGMVTFAIIFLSCRAMKIQLQKGADVEHTPPARKPDF